LEKFGFSLYVDVLYNVMFFYMYFFICIFLFLFFFVFLCFMHDIYVSTIFFILFIFYIQVI